MYAYSNTPEDILKQDKLILVSFTLSTNIKFTWLSMYTQLDK